jgi:molybdate transport system regulatory protein
VTEQGRALIHAYDTLTAALAAQMTRLGSALNGEDVCGLLESMTMKTSARNAWRGVVTAVEMGPVSAEVTLKVSDGLSIVAVVTRESVEDLGLAAGRSAVALVKASFVLLAAGHEPLPVSARNRIPGVISALSPGAVNDEVVLDAGDGKSVTAIVTHESCVELGLAVGGKAQALIKASHVILAVD